MPGQSYRDLEIYQTAHELAVRVHRDTLSLPKYEMYEEGSQLRRAAASVVANIVEGFGRRRYKPEFLKHLTYARASCDEVQAHLLLLFDCGSLPDERYQHLHAEYQRLGRMLYAFIEAVQSGHMT